MPYKDPSKHRDKLNANNRKSYHKNKERTSKDRNRRWMEFYYRNRIVRLAQTKMWTLKNWQQRLVSSAKASSKRKNLPECNLDKAYILELWNIQGGLCFWTGLPIIVGVPEKHPSLDRIIPSLGYIKGNVILTRWCINRFRGEMTPVEFEETLSELT